MAAASPVASRSVHVVIMGCGRVGSTIAHSLEVAGHSVAVVDQSAGAFRRLGPDLHGRQVTGVGFDRDTLIEAGIEEAGAVAAGSTGGNSNIISARVARQTLAPAHVLPPLSTPPPAQGYAPLRIPARPPP